VYAAQRRGQHAIHSLLPCHLITCDGETVGDLVGRIRPRSSVRPVLVAELESMYIQPHLRSQGLGQGLVERFLGWARANRTTRTTVVAYVAIQHAISFYRRVGLEPKSLSLEMGV
jgi:GNAT superfamily N-acetyltransferase